MFTSTLINVEVCHRNNLSYSVSTGKIFCVNFSLNGFSDWKHSNLVKIHENSAMHKTCMFKTNQRVSDLGRVDSQLIHNIQTETNYWKNILRWVCSVVKALSSHGLPFRGGNNKFEPSGENNGNFVMSMQWNLLLNMTFFYTSIYQNMVILVNDIPLICHFLHMSSLLKSWQIKWYVLL